MATAEEQAAKCERSFIDEELKYTRKDDYEKPVLVLNFGGGDFSYNHVAIHVIFDNDGLSAQLATSTIASVPAEKTARILWTMNECNKKFRWVKFYLDDDNDIIADCDVVFDELTVGDTCAEMVRRMASIIDDAYGDFMRAIWAD